MEVPPGRVERIADGGAAAIRSILEELRAMKFNGLLKTSVFRGDVPSEGVLVLRDGDGVLAEHRSSVDLAGRPAVPEILKDATSSKAQLEVRTYDYGHSSISIEQLQRSYPDASVDGIGDADALLTRVGAEEAAEREAYARDLDIRRDQEKSLIKRAEAAGTRRLALRARHSQGGERVDHATARSAQRVRIRGARITEASPRDGIEQGKGRARGPEEGSRGSGVTSLVHRTGARGPGDRLARSRGRTRFTRRFLRSRTETGERALQQPPGGDREDHGGPQDVRRTPSGGGATGTGAEPSGAVVPRVGRKTSRPRRVPHGAGGRGGRPREDGREPAQRSRRPSGEAARAGGKS